jgi:hypothetical protein
MGRFDDHDQRRHLLEKLHEPFIDFPEHRSGILGEDQVRLDDQRHECESQKKRMAHDRASRVGLESNPAQGPSERWLDSAAQPSPPRAAGKTP